MTEPEAEKRVSARLFNPSRLPIHTESLGLTREALDRLDAAERRCKKRQATAQLIHERAVTALTCDLVHLHLTKPTEWISAQPEELISVRPRRAVYLQKPFGRRDLLRALRDAVGKVDEVRSGGESGAVVHL
jgi:hypothetical protein